MKEDLEGMVESCTENLIAVSLAPRRVTGCGNPVEVMSAVSSSPELMMSQLQVWSPAADEVEYSFMREDEAGDAARIVLSELVRAGGSLPENTDSGQNLQQHHRETLLRLHEKGLLDHVIHEACEEPTEEDTYAWALSQKGWQELTVLQFFHNPELVFKEPPPTKPLQSMTAWELTQRLAREGWESKPLQGQDHEPFKSGGPVCARDRAPWSAQPPT